MNEELISRRDLAFQLFEVQNAQGLTQRTRHADHSRETFEAALATAHRIAEDTFAPHNRAADEAEPHVVAGEVVMVPGVQAAVRAYCEAGFLQATADESAGGMQLPVLVAQACQSIFRSANVATTSYVGLTASNANVIEKFGTPLQQARYLGALREGRFFGTMALTEPQAGSSLSDLKTSATPLDDGSYSIKGNKIFISGGDHNLSENIVHLVLARLPGSPAGVKGLSLFTVPKFRVDEAGRVGARNDVALGGLIHKCGWRGTTSTLLSFGENGACLGEIVGQPNQGLACMFHMMNEARIGVGMGAIMLGYRGYLASLRYAQERVQGRPLGNKDPLSPPVALIEHPDVRRMLLAQKSYVEGAYGLAMIAARLVDEQRTGETESARTEASLLLELLTPIVKSWPSQWCLEANSLAIQILGGYGYTREFPVEQYWRDNRLNMIHEGTHGVQALDLLGRKVVMKSGAALMLLTREMDTTIALALDAPLLRAHALQLQSAWGDIVSSVEHLKPTLASDGEAALANAHLFLEAFGHAVLAWSWLKQAVVADAALPAACGSTDESFYRGKLQACQWFFRWELPRIGAQLSLLRSLDDTTRNMQAAWF
ncbi:acyl-CoA dehydrogenase [Hydrogenophaga sp. PAMC20947]|uniref:acyl-CoA dehydrogenase n=1 Tax=Hydrogenophaga sp. PAMC20947 TaxID=2565558 RepID=UPI00109DF425|nr:acyl-CoA dehydrogenase [Hydrogenophaga sp. PAMC20947]QCB46494.1 acyl-CoA dehydrogenase [Hydrogenophaga sp. PAMC20947]